MLVSMYIGAAAMENSMGSPQKIKNSTTIWSRFLIAFVHYSQYRETSQMCDEWVKKMWYVCMYNGVLSVIKRKLVLFLTKRVNQEDIVLSEISQIIKYVVTYMWNLKTLNSQNQRVEQWFPGGGRWGKYRDVGQSVQAFSYKMSKVWGCNVQHCDYNK